MAAILAHLPQDLSDEASKIEQGEVKSNSNTSRISQLRERLNSLQIRQKIIIYVIIILQGASEKTAPQKSHCKLHLEWLFRIHW